MNMHWIDWTIVAGFMLILTVVAIVAKRYNKSVADFLVANRCAGRYLLSISQGVAGIGAISFIAFFEMYYKAGFTASWWLMITLPVGLFVALSGWIIYRYRESRVMTLAQLFEVRYSRNFRVFCGIIAWAAGVINMGIFPAVTARFFMYFCGLPETFLLPFVGWEFSTFAAIMIVELSIALLFTFLGGMIAVMITDFLQGIFCNVAFLVILLAMFFYFDWDQIISALQSTPNPETASKLNPFHVSKVDGFNMIYFLMLGFTAIYACRAWQGAQGYNAAAKNAHEAKMAGIIGTWRGLVQTLLVMMLPICAYTLMHHADFASHAQAVNETLSTIGDETIRGQMIVPLALTKILPVGMIGLFCAVMLAAAISTDDTYLHSWGSIFIQDVILPFRKNGFTPKQHMWLLRGSIFFVALFIFFFSLFFKQTEYIFMYFALTGAIFIGGAGSVIIGGLYWKRGSTGGAWGAMIVGGGLACSGLAIQGFWDKIVPMLLEWFPHSQFLVKYSEKFPLNGMEISFYAILCAIATYVGFSLWSWLVLKNPAFNMEQMLHRGKYAIKGEHEKEVKLPATGLKAILPDKEFTTWDKILYLSLTIWILAWFVFFIGVAIYHYVISNGTGPSEEWWLGFWSFKIWLTVGLGIFTTLWFLFGGFRDLLALFRTLKTFKRNELDDGRVAGHHSLVDETLEAGITLDTETSNNTADPEE